MGVLWSLGSEQTCTSPRQPSSSGMHSCRRIWQTGQTFLHFSGKPALVLLSVVGTTPVTITDHAQKWFFILLSPISSSSSEGSLQSGKFNGGELGRERRERVGGAALTEVAVQIAGQSGHSGPLWSPTDTLSDTGTSGLTSVSVDDSVNTTFSPASAQSLKFYL